MDPAYRPIPPHVRFVSVAAANNEQVRACLDHLVRGDALEATSNIFSSLGPSQVEKSIFEV